MFSSLFFLLIGSVGLYFGSEWLINGAKDLAKALKVSDLVIGLTIVSIGTSFPELVVGLISAFQGYTDFVIGNVLGSNIANIGLAIGLPALIFKINFEFKNITAPVVYNLIACIMLYFILTDNEISILEAQALLMVFFIYIIASFMRPNITSCDGELENTTISPFYISVLKIITGSVILYSGSELFVSNGAVPLVENFGFNEKSIGMTVVAIGTSLPELFVTIMALSKKEVGISLGNIIGSNIFNILFVLSTIALVSPISTTNVTFELSLGVVFLISLMIFIYFQKGINRVSASLLLVAYIIFIYIQFYG